MIETWLLAVMAAWMVVLTVVLVLVVRQIGLITVRLGRNEPEAATADDGLDVGDAVPAAALEHLPASGSGRRLALFVSVNCFPCREMASVLDRVDYSELTAVVVGADPTDMLSLLPDDISVVSGPDATACAEGFSISTVPFVFEVRDGTVTGKAVLRGLPDLDDFIDARPPVLEVIRHG